MSYHSLNFLDEKLSKLIEELVEERDSCKASPQKQTSLTRLIETLKEVEPFIPKGTLSAQEAETGLSDLAGLAAREAIDQ